MPKFQDHFSGHATAYAHYRPHYPEALFRALRTAAPEGNVAWDVGCGNGQASIALASHFSRVFATDASPQQIDRAALHSRVRYSVASAEASGLADHSVDAILVAQALHWFDFERFYAEVRRVARPDAVIAAVVYELATITPAIDRQVLRFYRGGIGPFWPPDRAHIETGYRNIPWPFSGVELPPLTMAVEWSLADLMGYLGTWSAVVRYRQATGQDPLPEFERDLTVEWGDPQKKRTVSWPLVTLAGRVGSTELAGSHR